MPGPGKVVDVELDRLAAVLRGERQRQLALTGDEHVGRAVLIAERVTADHDRLRPARHQPRDVRDHDRLAEDHAAEDVPDRAVRRAVHTLQAELLHARLVGGDRRALHADAVPLDRLGRFDGDLVVGRVAALDPEVVVLQLHVQVRQDQLVPDERPDDPRHLVAVELDYRVLHLDLRHVRSSGVLSCRRTGDAIAAAAVDAVRTEKTPERDPPGYPISA